MRAPAWADARNILCVRLDYLGDVLMMTPAMRALKQSAPERRLTLLSSGAGAAAARYIPEIDAAIPYAAPWLKSSVPHAPGVDLEMISTLTAHRFDAAVIFTTYSQSALPAALLCQLASIPLRLAHCRENPYQLLTDWVPESEPQQQLRHEVRRQLDLVASIGCHVGDERLSFHVPAADAAWASRFLLELGIDAAQPWIILHPGATAASRRYPPAQWVSAGRELAARLGCPLLVTGGADETALVTKIGAAIPGAHALAGAPDLGKLAALIAAAPLLISNNTGPAHLAAALGTPVVDLYALTNPQHAPWRVPSRVLFADVPCRWCYKSACPQGHHACLTQVAPARVVEAALDLLQGARDHVEMLPVAAPLDCAPRPGL